jgi:hypothetical protein
MELDEGQVELGDDDVLVVAGIADEGPALLVAGQVLPGQGGPVDVDVGVAPGQQLDAAEPRVGPLVQVRAVVGKPATVPAG